MTNGEVNLIKIALNSGKEDLLLYVDPKKVVAIQVQMPLESALIQDGSSLGMVKIFCKDVTYPFQITRNTKKEIDEVLSQLL